MSETGDRLLAFRGAAQTPDRRPSLNTQAAIDAYDYRFAAWEVIDGGDIKEVCRRLDVPGGPSVLGPKVAALRARLEASERMGRTPPERPTQPPVSPLTNASASVPLESWSAKSRPGIAFDATDNPSASQMKGRALVTLSAAPSYEAPALVPVAAPWREALTIKVSAAAVQAVAEQEGRDPVKDLRAAGFAERAEALRAEIAASMLADATAPPLPAPPVEHPGVAFVGRPISGSMWMGSLGPLPMPTFSVITGLADDIPDIPTPADLAAEAEAAEAPWEQRHNEDTVRAAQAEHARQRELLQQLGDEEREEAGADAQTPTPPQTPAPPPLQDASPAVAPASPPPPPPAPPPGAPVARGRSTKTLAASAETPVVKAPLRGRAAPPPVAPPPVAPPVASAAPAKPLPLPTWSKKAKAEPSDPPPKRDRSKNRKVAPKPPEPPQPVLLGMSPETTTPTDIGRPKRRTKVAAPAPVVEAPKAAPTPESRRRRGQPNPPPDMTMLVPPKVQRRVGPAMTALLHEAARGCALTKIGVTPIADGYLWTGEQADDELHAQLDTKKADWSQHHQRTVSLRMQAVQRARVRPIDLKARKKEVDDNLAALRRCPTHAGVSDAVWQAGLETIAQGLSTVNQWNDELTLPKSTLSYWMRRHGVNSKLLPDLLSHRGRHPHTTGTNKASELGLVFGRGVRRQRAIYGLTQIELAVALRIHSSMLPCIEQGIVQPRVELVRRLTDLFKVPWRSLFEIDDVQLLTLLVAGIADGARNHCCGDLLRHLVLPAFGVEVPRLTDHQKRVVKGYRADKSVSQTPTPPPPPVCGRIEARPSNISEWSRVRYAVCIGDREIAYADTLKGETPERVRQLLQNQLVINARQGGDGLPRGWLALLPDDLGPGVSGRLKEELMELRDRIDNIEHALGLPARFWSGPDQECDADLTDAERHALGAPPAQITNRAQLLIDPTEGDSCDDYTTEPQVRDCHDDGHYLCEGCGRFNRERRARDFDVDDQVKS